MRTPSDERAPAPLFEGLVAGLAFALADAAAGGALRHAPLFTVVVGAGLVGGLLAGGLATLTGRSPGRATALVVSGAAALNGLSLVSKELPHLAGGARAAVAGVIVLTALAAGWGALRAIGRDALRLPRLFGAALFLCAGVPAASLAWSFAPGTAAALVACALVPALFAWLGARFVTPRAVRTAVADLALLALFVTLPALEDDLTVRPRAEPAGATRATPPTDAPSVVLILVDTLRADAVEARLDGSESPGALARLADEGVRFERAVAAAPWTLPSMASLFTSLYPSQHGAVTARRPLADEATTLAELLRDAGWDTAAFTGGGFVGPTFGLDQGFDHFDPRGEVRFRSFRRHTPLAWRLVKNRFWPQRWVLRHVREFGGVATLRERALDWLDRHGSERPFLLLVHTYEVHDYYVYDPPADDALLAERRPPARWGERLSVHPSELAAADQAELDWFAALYAGRVRHVDRELGQLLAQLEERADPARLITVLTSDHGEGFDAERGRFHHGGRLHDDLLCVPLFLRAPGRLAAGHLERAPVRTVDLLPTLLELCGLPIPEGLAGRSLGPALAGNEPFPETAWGEESPGQRAARTPDWKLIATPEGEQAYDLRSDPAESRPVPDRLPDAVRELMRAFPGRYPPVIEATDAASIDAETRAQLRALGYVDDSP